MIGRFVKGRVYVFVDAANIFYSQRTLKWHISYERLRDYFKSECDLRKMFVYVGSFPDEKQKKFLDMLEINNYIVRTKPVKKIRLAKGVYEFKGNFDIELAMDMVDTINEYDTAILLSGDSDFAPIIDRIKEKGKWVIVMSTKHHISRELLQRAKYVNLKKLKERIILLK
jgi:uncharacterized LabA/DUF88 family protein